MSDSLIRLQETGEKFLPMFTKFIEALQKLSTQINTQVEKKPETVLGTGSHQTSASIKDTASDIYDTAKGASSKILNVAQQQERSQFFKDVVTSPAQNAKNKIDTFSRFGLQAPRKVIFDTADTASQQQLLEYENNVALQDKVTSGFFTNMGIFAGKLYHDYFPAGFGPNYKPFESAGTRIKRQAEMYKRKNQPVDAFGRK